MSNEDGYVAEFNCSHRPGVVCLHTVFPLTHSVEIASLNRCYQLGPELGLPHPEIILDSDRQNVQIGVLYTKDRTGQDRNEGQKRFARLLRKTGIFLKLMLTRVVVACDFPPHFR